MTGFKLLLLHSNIWNYLNVCKKNQAHLKMLARKCLEIIYLIHMYKQHLNAQWLIYLKIKPNQTKPNQNKTNQNKTKQTAIKPNQPTNRQICAGTAPSLFEYKWSNTFSCFLNRK